MRWASCALALLGWWALAGSVRADEAVFRRTDATGRSVYTNIGNVAVRGVPLEALDLPQLERLDVAQLPPSELAQFDTRIDEALAMTQAGPQCAAIRSASRVPFRDVLWGERRRELFTAFGLFAFSVLLGFAVQRRALRSLLPIAPFMGALFVGYVAVARSQDALAQLHRALRACSADLPEREPTSVDRIKQRLSSAIDIKANIEQGLERRQQRMDAQIDRTLR